MSSRKVLLVLLSVYCFLCLVVIVSSSSLSLTTTSPSDNVDFVEKEKIDMFAPRRRKKHTKYFVPLLTAALLIKSVLFPLAFKSMAIMAGVSIILSTLSLLVSSMVGFAKTAKDSYLHYASRRTQPSANEKYHDGENIKDEISQNGGDFVVGGAPQLGNRFILNPKLKTINAYGYKHPNYI